MSLSAFCVLSELMFPLFQMLLVDKETSVFSIPTIFHQISGLVALTEKKSC
jgi:hypothetical protein